MYTHALMPVSKLIFLVGIYAQTAKVKKVLQANDQSNKITYRCVENIPENTLTKIKPKVSSKGILRADWLNKIMQRYPQMVIFVFNCSEQTDLQKLQSKLRQILKKVNLLVADVLKPNNKQQVQLRVIIMISRGQANNQLVMQKISYFMKQYEKDTYVMAEQLMGKEISKYRSAWMQALEKNYQRKLKKLVKQYEEEMAPRRRINLAFKIAVLSQILGKQQKQNYRNLYSAIQFHYYQLCKNQDTSMLKFLQLRQLRILANTTILRDIKFRVTNQTQKIPQFIMRHLNVFKLHNIDPRAMHFFYYFDQLMWRAQFFESLLQIFETNDLFEYLPHVNLAEYMNALLTYLHRLATIQPQLKDQLTGRKVVMGPQIYLGRYNLPQDASDIDLLTTGVNNLIQSKKDFIIKGIQTISRYRHSDIFKENQNNFLNIYLIRFHLAAGTFQKIVTVYNEIMAVQVSRSNFFLINQLLNEMHEQAKNIDRFSRILIYGVASLICDYFHNKNQLRKYLKTYFQITKDAVNVSENILDMALETPAPQLKDKNSNKSGREDTHVFRLKRSSHIMSATVTINDQLLLTETPYKIKLSLSFHQLIRQAILDGGCKLQLHFNQKDMIVQVPLQLQASGNLFQTEIRVQPLAFILKDAVLQITQIQLAMASRNAIWLIQRNQIVFERFDSSLFYCKMLQPQVRIQGLQKVYYLNETAYFKIAVGGVQDCKVLSKFSVVDQGDGKTQQKKDLANAKIFHQLQVGQGSSTASNVCWIRCSSIGSKKIRLHFVHNVQKAVTVSWRDKPLNIRAQYKTMREIIFGVSSLFTISKTFKEALTGTRFDKSIPINKRILLCFQIKADQNIDIRQLGHHNNPRKIKYYKNIRLQQTQLQKSQALKLNMVFELQPDCGDEVQLFLTTLFIKWRRHGKQFPFDNIHLDQQTKISGGFNQVVIAPQQPRSLVPKQKGFLRVYVKNLTTANLQFYATMDSTQQLLRIGDRGKYMMLMGDGSVNFDFQVLCMHSGIYQFPPVRVWVGGDQIDVPVINVLVNCE